MSEALNCSHGDFLFRDFARPLSLLLGVVFLSALLGNVLLLLAVARSERLRVRPMFVLIAALCVADLLSVLVIVPRMLSGLSRVSPGVCLLQMFLTHLLSSVESTLLLVMALDRYAAVCQPLRYARLARLCTPRTLLLIALGRGAPVMAALVALAAALCFCGSRVIPHCYCDHMALVGLACGRTEKNRAAGLAVIVCFVGVDIPVICFSYVKVLAVVLAGEERRKAVHTCSTHLMVMACFYLVGTVTFLSHSSAIATDVNIFMGVAYILLPATVNPIIYGVRTTEIRNELLKLFPTNAVKPDRRKP